MTIYEMNYKVRLDEMRKEIIANYGEGHHCTEYFNAIHNKYYNNANYQNRETVEKIYKGLIKNLDK